MSDLRDPARRVSPRARVLWQVECVTAAGIAVLGLAVAALFWDAAFRWWVVGGAAALGTSYAVVVPQWRYAVHRWEVTGTAVYTQRGWWARERRIAPMSRVQTVDLAQGALDRLFGLATVTVTTASAAGPLRIEGLDLDVAAALVTDLMAKTDLDAGDAT